VKINKLKTEIDSLLCATFKVAKTENVGYSAA